MEIVCKHLQSTANIKRGDSETDGGGGGGGGKVADVYNE